MGGEDSFWVECPESASQGYIVGVSPLRSRRQFWAGVFDFGRGTFTTERRTPCTIFVHTILRPLQLCPEATTISAHLLRFSERKKWPRNTIPDRSFLKTGFTRLSTKLIA